MPRAVKPKSNGSFGDDNRTTSQRQVDPQWGGFLNLRLTEEEVASFKDWSSDPATQIWVIFVDVLNGDLKYSIAWDKENQCYIASLTGRLIPGQETRYATSARAMTWEEATALLLYKHTVLADGNWANFMPRTGTLNQFG